MNRTIEQIAVNLDNPGLSDKQFRELTCSILEQNKYSNYGKLIINESGRQFCHGSPVCNGAHEEMRYYDRVFSSEILQEHEGPNKPLYVRGVSKYTDDYVMVELSSGAIVPACSCFPTFIEAAQHTVKRIQKEIDDLRANTQSKIDTLIKEINAINRKIEDGFYLPKTESEE